MKTLSITLASLEDAALVASILTEATTRKVDYGDTSWGSGEWTAEEVQHLMQEQPTYIVKIDNEAAGTVSLSYSEDDKWQGIQKPAVYVHQLAVLDNFSGQNLGARILDWAAKEACKHGCTFVRLDCHARNKRLCRFYERQGFNKVATTHSKNGNIAALYERIIKK